LPGAFSPPGMTFAIEDIRRLYLWSFVPNSDRLAMTFVLFAPVRGRVELVPLARVGVF